MHSITTKVRALAVALVLGFALSACSNGSSVANTDYLQLAKLDGVTCTANNAKQVTKDLAEAEAYVDKLQKESTSRQAEDVLALNPGKKLFDIKAAIVAKKTECGVPAGTADAGVMTDEQIKALTVTTLTYSCTTVNGLVSWEIQSLRSGRKWSDSVGLPLPAKATIDEVYRSICVDPTYGAMVGDYFAGLRSGKESTLTGNPWLKQWVGDANQDATVAASYLTLLNVENPTPQQLTTAIAKNKEWQIEAARLVTLLQKFKHVGVEAEQSVSNYHVLGGGLVADRLPVIGLNDQQESLPAFQLKQDSKTDDCVIKIGFNMADRRLEVFSCVKVKAEAPAKVKTKTTSSKGSSSTEKCPWNPNLSKGSSKCLKPKSTDPDDYKVENGAPKAKVKGLATDPSVVDTTTDTGGSASDTAGSETDIGATGADTDSGQEGEDPLPAEGGANTDTSGGACVRSPDGTC